MSLDGVIGCEWCGEDVIRDSPRRNCHDACRSEWQRLGRQRWQERKRLGLSYWEGRWTQGDRDAFLELELGQDLDEVLRRMNR